MQIDIIDSMPRFDALRIDWDRVYDADPDARYFLSFNFLRRHLSSCNDWFILGFKDNDENSYSAFLPLRLKTIGNRQTGHFRDEILMAGNYVSDYTGIIAFPQKDIHACHAFAHCLREQHWGALRLLNLAGSKSRRDALLTAFVGPEFTYQTDIKYINGNIDNSICPVAPLPDTWDAYLQCSLSAQTRQKLARFIRKTEADPAYRITHATPETINRDLDILFDLWRAKWSKVKGSRTDSIVRTSRQMLEQAFRAGELLVSVFWFQDRPLGVLANLLDDRKKAMLFYITGRDEEWKLPSPGLILHAHCIRLAIEKGYRSYDFLRGNEQYKYSFGVEEQTVHSTVIERRKARCLNERSIPFVYKQAKIFLEQANLAAAEHAYRQVLVAQPQNGSAIYGLALTLLKKSDFTGTERLFRKLVKARPDHYAFLLRLGDICAATGRHDEAVKFFRDALAAKPSLSEACYKAGMILLSHGNRQDAEDMFRWPESQHADDHAFIAYKDCCRQALARMEKEPVLNGELKSMEKIERQIEMKGRRRASRGHRPSSHRLH